MFSMMQTIKLNADRSKAISVYVAQNEWLLNVVIKSCKHNVGVIKGIISETKCLQRHMVENCTRNFIKTFSLDNKNVNNLKFFDIV